MISPKSTRPGVKSNKPEREAAEDARESSKKVFLTKYEQLKSYATSIDLNAVKIRLNDAHKAAEAIDELKFESISCNIMTTLEERYDRIVTARACVPGFSRVSLPPTPNSPSPQSSHGRFDTASPSQLSP